MTAGFASATSASAASMSSGSPSTTGPGRPDSATWIGAAHVLRDALGIADDGDPFHERAEQALGLDLLERLAVLGVGGGQAEEQDHRRRILLRDMQPAMALARPGPRVTKQRPGVPVSLP